MADTVIIRTNDTSLCLFMCLMLFSTFCCGDRLPGVCSPNIPNQQSLPAIPQQFTVNVQCNLVDRNQTIDIKEYSDSVKNLGRISQESFLFSSDVYFDYNHNEVLVVDTDSGVCQVYRMEPQSNDFLVAMSIAGNQRHAFSLSTALNMANGQVQYQDHGVIRGIPSNKWTSCQYSPSLDATMAVSWYFSDSRAWDMQLGALALPVRVEVKGKRNDGQGGIHPFHHIYDFFGLKDTVDPTDVQLQPGYYCPGRFNTKPFPKLPDVFSITGELLDFSSNTVNIIEEHYNKVHQINIYSYKDQDHKASLTGINGMTAINDFKEGTAYTINAKDGTCQIMALEDSLLVNFELVNGVPTLRSPLQFFDADINNMEYGGQKTEDGMVMETWVGVNAQPHFFNGENITMEWSFEMSAYTSWSTTPRVPRRIMAWEAESYGVDDSIYQYNFFHLGQNQFPIFNVDICYCFQGSAKANVRFRLESQYRNAVLSSGTVFKEALVNNFAVNLGISPLRMVDVVVDTGSDLAVSLDLAEKASIEGSAVRHSVVTQVSSLQRAVSLLNSDIWSTFTIPFERSDSSVATVKPIYQSLEIFFSNGTCLGPGCPPPPASTPVTSPESSPSVTKSPLTLPQSSPPSQTSSPKVPVTRPPGANHVNGTCGTAQCSPSMSKQYSGGSLAAVAVVMLLTGHAVGLGGGYFWFRRTR